MVIAGLNQRDVRFGIRNGLSVEDFCAKYNCNTEEFLKRIHTIYRHDTQKMIDAIENNGKRQARQKNSKKSSNPSEITQDATANTNPSIPFSPSPEPTSDSLTLLKKQEQDLSAKVIALESQHKSISKQHREHLRELRTLDEELRALRQTFEEKVTNYESIASHCNELVTLMNQISQERSQEVQTLAKLRQEIKSLSEVAICIYDNGKIELMESNFDGEIILDETGSEQLFINLRDREDLEELRIKDVKILSRILSIISNLDMRIVPIFENSELEPYFQGIRAS